MATGKKTFVFYSDWVNMIREMPDKDAGELLKHILSYVNDENPETKNLLVRMAFGHMKPLLKADLIKWDSIREKRSEYGKKGGKANAKQKQANAKQVEAVNENVNVNVNGNVNETVNDSTLKKVPKKGKDCKEGEVTIWPDFQDIWDHYEKKIGSGAKLKKKWAKIPQKTKEDIYQHVTDYKQAQPDKKYRKNLETYLNNEGWNDEIIKRADGRNTGSAREDAIKRLSRKWEDQQTREGQVT